MLPTQIYFYNLLQDRIAQRPVHPSHDAKLMIINRADSTVETSSFLKLCDWLNAGDLLVFNDTRVMPARLFGSIDGLEREVELLLIRRTGTRTWVCIGKPLKRFRENRVIKFGDKLEGIILKRLSDKAVEIEFHAGASTKSLEDLLLEYGTMPIPPYIRNGKGDERDRSDYQTIFAQVDGSIAAPTASLHFTDELMKCISDAGCKVAFLTLHVGTASFLPLEHNNSDGFIPPSEENFQVSEELIALINIVKSNGNKLIAVGTTVVRALESAWNRSPEATEIKDSTNLFIQPGYEFKVVDGLITNFHQPGTTHLLLVEALLGRALLDRSYRYALKNDFRFLSYGDGMFVMP